MLLHHDPPTIRDVRAVTVAWLACVACGLVGSSAARAQSDDGGAADPLAPARLLFAEALRDEEGGRFADALHKFERVRAVRDTAPIEYRIGTCEEGLGDAPAAYLAYRSAIALGQGDAANIDVVRSAVDRLDALARLVARLTLVLPESAPPETDVRIDDVAVSRSAMGQPIPVAPGHHVVTTAAAGASPFRSEIFVPAGGQASMTLSIASIPAASSAESPAAPHASPAARRTTGFVLSGASAPVLVAALALLVAREHDIATLDRACPHGVCPPGADVAGLQTTRDRALAEGPLAAALGITGAAMAGIGAYLVLSARPEQNSPAASVGALLAVAPWGVRLAGSFP